MAERKYGQEQRRDVLLRIDRGETIRAASIAAGVSPHTGYRWAKQAGLTTSRSSPRTYSDEQKALLRLPVEVDIELAGFQACWEDVSMSNSRRAFTPEYKVEAAHRVIDSGRNIAETARELAVSEQLLGRWVREERVRIEAAASLGQVPLDGAERTELTRLRRQVAEQEKDINFLKKHP